MDHPLPFKKCLGCDCTMNDVQILTKNGLRCSYCASGKKPLKPFAIRTVVDSRFPYELTSVAGKTYHQTREASLRHAGLINDHA